MNYIEASNRLGSRDSRKLENNTYLHRTPDGHLAVRLHATDVVTFYPEKTVLHSGGWRTVTTKDRINEYSPVRIYQTKGVWYMPDGSLFYDGVAVDVTGGTIDPRKPDTREKDLHALKRDIKRYVSGFCDHIKAGKLELPGNGDCWGCLFRDKNHPETEPMGTDHLRQHMTEDERYYVPSLLWNAIKAKGYRSPEFIYQMIQSDGKNGKLYCGTARILRDYLTKRLQRDLETEREAA